MSWAQETVARRLRFQADGCSSLGSPLYARLLGAAADDVVAGGATWELLEGRERDPGPSALGLRLMGAVHRLVLEGRAPRLARHFPSAGGDLGGDAWPALQEVMVEHRSELRERLLDPVQTNEVGRSAAMLGGFLLVARATRLPLRLLEVGASAGLNLRWDRFHYAWADGLETWGDAASPVQLKDFLVSGRLPRPARVVVSERSGCDPEPLDPARASDRLTLLAYIWADQPARIERLRAALEVAAQVPARVDRARAGDWLVDKVSAPVSGQATVLFHSVVMQYLDDLERARFAGAIAAGAATASTTAPFAWLRMEPVPGTFEVRLTLWPGGEERLLATCGAHGFGVEWLA